MKEMGRNQQLRTGEVLIIVVVLFMWAGESGPEPSALHPHQTLFPQKRRVGPLEAVREEGLGAQVLLWVPGLTDPSSDPPFSKNIRVSGAAL